MVTFSFCRQVGKMKNVIMQVYLELLGRSEQFKVNRSQFFMIFDCLVAQSTLSNAHFLTFGEFCAYNYNDYDDNDDTNDYFSNTPCACTRDNNTKHKHTHTHWHTLTYIYTHTPFTKTCHSFETKQLIYHFHADEVGTADNHC